MRNDKYTEFDLQIRSMLQDAEEEIPSLAWESLSSELDRRDRRKVVALRWRRAAYGVAAAAAVVAGVFLSTNIGGVQEDSRVQPVIAQTQPVTAPSISAQEAGPTMEEQIAAKAGRMLADVPARPSKGSASTMPDSVMPVEELDSPAEDVEGKSSILAEGEKAIAKDDGASRTGNVQEEEWVDHFARLAYEEEHARNDRRGVTLFIDGNASSNDKDADPTKLPSRAGAEGKTTGITEKSMSTYGIPLTFGVGAKFQVADRVAVGTGLNWSLLTRSFSGIYTEVNGNDVKSVNSNITNEIHYLGIPLNLYFDIMSNRDMKFYVWGGGSAEKGLVNKYRIYSQPEDIIYKESVKGIQWSAAAGLGLEFALTDKMGLYIDPSARYYFDCDQPNSVRTMKPFMLNFEVGLRFDLL